MGEEVTRARGPSRSESQWRAHVGRSERVGFFPASEKEERVEGGR